MNLFEDIKVYLPKYLSAESQKELFMELSNFPDNGNKSYYTDMFSESESLLQGDKQNARYIASR